MKVIIILTASTMAVPYDLDSGASLGQFAVDTLDSEFDPTLSNLGHENINSWQVQI